MYQIHMNTLLEILLATGVISSISLVGVTMLSIKFLQTKKAIVMLVSFAAGVLLTTSIISIFPEALEGLDAESALRWFMIGIVGSFLLERFFVWHHHHDDKHNLNPTAALIIVGDAVHNLIDGFAIAAAFLVHPALGLSTTIAIAAHEIPQEIADFSILRYTGLSRRKALSWNFISALAAVAGGIIGFYILREAFELIYIALAITAGIFLYVATADLIPELHKSESQKDLFTQSILFIVGIILMMTLTSITPHPHEDEHDANTETRIEREIGE